MNSFLRHFPNLVLDEEVSYDFHEIEKKRVLRESRIVRRNRLKALNTDYEDLVGTNINGILDYSSLARKVFLYDELPSGALARYDSDGDSYVLSNRKFDVEHVTGDSIFVPMIEFARNRITKHTSDWFMLQEHNALFALLKNTEQKVTDVGDITTAAINSAFREIEQHDLVASTILVGDWALSVINNFGSDFYDRASPMDMRYRPYFRGHLYTADICYSSHPALANKTYILSSQDTVGAFSTRGYTSWPKFHLQEWGMTLVNPYAVSCIETV